jgi:hypothetical protein
MFQAKIIERFASLKSLYISLENVVLLLALKCVKRLLIGGIIIVTILVRNILMEA